MIISFDLDDVLFVSPDKFETEPPLPFPINRIYTERLRKGTPKLIHELQKEGFEVWIYTSSDRKRNYLTALFRAYGIRFDDIVNASRHEEEVQRNRKERLPLKLPNFYHIALHIDDDRAVEQNGKTYGFRTMRVDEPDEEWAEKVLAEANRVRRIVEG